MIPQLHECVNHFKEKILNKVEGSFWVAGGALRDYFLNGNTENSADIDLFFPNHMTWERVKNYLISQNYQPIYESSSSYKMRKDNETYDLVKIFSPNPQNTIFYFDFTVCCCAVDRFGIYHHETFFIDLAQRRLVNNDLSKPFNAISRVRKYIAKGFYIDNKNFFEIIRKVREAPESEFPDSIRNLDIAVGNNRPRPVTGPMTLNPTRPVIDQEPYN